MLNINEVIKRQSDIHGGTFIDINKTFYNKNNQLKSLFYKPRDNIHLSSSGTRGLLGCINQHIDIVESFKHCAYHGPSAKIDSAAYPRRNESRLSAPSSNNHQGRGVQHHNNAEKCFKCGLTNHKTYQCRHKNSYNVIFASFMVIKIQCVGTFRTVANMPLILINTLYFCQKIDTILYKIYVVLVIVLAVNVMI